MANKQQQRAAGFIKPLPVKPAQAPKGAAPDPFQPVS